ncbi:hypothetical protein NMG60_11018992 [Bertholletia excelsa]
MSSMSFHSGVRGTFSCPSFTSQKSVFVGPIKTSIAPKHNASITNLRRGDVRRIRMPIALAAAEAVEAETSTEEVKDSVPTQETQKPVVGAKQIVKPRLMLKFIWMEKNIGLALDQVIPGHGTVPLSPYFFWPRKDAWEELKATLESKPWISQKKMIILLNQATDIINLWQQSGGSLS